MYTVTKSTGKCIIFLFLITHQNLCPQNVHNQNKMQWDACYTVFQNGMKGLNSRFATCKIQSTNYIDQTSHCCSQTINSKHKSP